METGCIPDILTIELGLVPVSIAIRTPPYILDLRYPKLAPTPELFFEWKYGNHRGDNAYYTKRFTEEVLGKFKDPAFPTTGSSSCATRSQGSSVTVTS